MSAMPSPRLSASKTQAIERRIAGIEARTGTQIVVAIVGRCDRYPEARWKAFALGVSLAALGVVALDLLWPDRGGDALVLGSIVVALGAGAANALAAHYLAAYARIYVRHDRAEAEARQYAESMFLSHGLFATPRRTGVLVLVGLFERAVVIHPDVGFAGRIRGEEWQGIVEVMTAALRVGERAAAFESGFVKLEALLDRKGFAAFGGAANALPDTPIQEDGA